MNTNRRLTMGIVGVVSVAALSACSPLDSIGSAQAKPAAAAPTKAVVAPLKSTFTTEGAFQSHLEKDGVDFVYTVWPSKRTPDTGAWYPAGDKYFNVTLQAYDLDRSFRSSFSSKRKVYLGNMRITTQTVTTSGSTESPYAVSRRAKEFTFDPDPLSTKRGMLITSPKGSFELRNRRIGSLSRDTRGINMTLEGEVQVQSRPGSKRFVSRLIRVNVPIGIIDSGAPTPAKDVPDDAL